MELFDKRFVHCMWDEKLEGKEAFVGDNLAALRTVVDGDSASFRTTVMYSGDDDWSFTDNKGKVWRYAYYDPNYGLKVAHVHGAQIQMLKVNGDWIDISDPSWDDIVEYRIKPEEQKPLKLEYNGKFKLGDKVRTKDGWQAIITAIEHKYGRDYCYIAGHWFEEDDLEAME